MMSSSNKKIKNYKNKNDQYVTWMWRENEKKNIKKLEKLKGEIYTM